MRKQTLFTAPLRYWLQRLMFATPNRIGFGGLIALMTAVFGMALLGLSGWFITATSLAGVAIASGLVIAFDVFLPGGGIRFFALSRTVSRYVERLYNHDTVLRQLAQARQELFAGLTQKTYAQQRGMSKSEWLSRLTVDLDALDGLLLRIVLPPLVALGAMLIGAAFIAWFWWPLAIVMLVVFLPLCVMVLIRLMQQTMAEAEHYGMALNQARQTLMSHLGGFIELQASGLLEQHSQTLHQLNTEIQQAQARLSQFIFNGQMWVSMLHGVFVVFIVLASLYGVTQGLFTGPIAVMMLLAVYGLSEVLLTLPMQIGQLGKIHYAAGRLYHMAQQQPEALTERTLKKPHFSVSSSDPIVPILTIHQHPRIPASWSQTLRFDFIQDNLIWVTGRSGMGKSSIADGLAGMRLSDDASNELILDGYRIEASNQADYQAHIAYLQQTNTVLAASVFDNLTLGLTQVDEDDVWQLLHDLELASWVDRLPNGLNTWMGDQGNQLSGGQARRLCLARVLLRPAAVYILDEPFNGLDAAMAERLWRVIYSRLQQKKVLILMHETATFTPTEATVVDLF